MKAIIDGNKRLFTKEYGERMAAARDAKGLSQTQAGKRLGKARETLSLLERGLFTYAPFPWEMDEYEGLYGLTQTEQLSILGYDVKSLLGGLTDQEIDLLNMFRTLGPSLRPVLLLLTRALTESQLEPQPQV